MQLRATLAAAALLTGAAFPAAAQVVYDRAQHAYRYAIPPVRNGLVLPYGDATPAEVALGTRPSYEIIPAPNPYGPVVRVIQRCEYPNGWNVTDFDRDLNGIPAGADHACPAPAPYGRVRARY